MKIMFSKNPKEDRKVLEHKKADILINPKKINHVLAKIAEKNKIAVGFDLSELVKFNKKNKAVYISRLISIIKTLKKAKTKLKILNYKDKKDAFSLFTSLGASSKQLKEAF